MHLTLFDQGSVKIFVTANPHICALPKSVKNCDRLCHVSLPKPVTGRNVGRDRRWPALKPRHVVRVTESTSVLSHGTATNDWFQRYLWPYFQQGRRPKSLITIMAGRTTLLLWGDARLTLAVYVGRLSAGPCGTAVFKLSSHAEHS